MILQRHHESDESVCGNLKGLQQLTFLQWQKKTRSVRVRINHLLKTCCDVIAFIHLLPCLFICLKLHSTSSVGMCYLEDGVHGDRQWAIP